MDGCGVAHEESRFVRCCNVMQFFLCFTLCRMNILSHSTKHDRLKRIKKRELMLVRIADEGEWNDKNDFCERILVISEGKCGEGNCCLHSI